MDRITSFDQLFQNKLYFYLAKEKVDYDQVDAFLNSYILRYWPALTNLVCRDRRSKETTAKKQPLDRVSVKDSNEHSDWKSRVLEQTNLKRLK